VLYKDEIERIKKYLVSKLELKEFPDILIDKVLPNISTEDINKGEFTFYKGFFQREYDTR